EEILELVLGEIGEGGEGLTASQVQALIDASLTDYLTEAEIRDLILEVLDDEGLTTHDVDVLIQTALLDLELGLDAAEVQGLIDTALGTVTGDILDDVNVLVGGLLGGVEESLESALTDELTLRQTSV